jgi:hypothetical protein
LEGLWFGIYISIAIFGCSKGVNNSAVHGTQLPLCAITTGDLTVVSLNNPVALDTANTRWTC